MAMLRERRTKRMWTKSDRGDTRGNIRGYTTSEKQGHIEFYWDTRLKKDG